MTHHPDAYQGAGPADRVRAFLDARAGARGLDPEQLLSYGARGVVYELTASDLRAATGEQDSWLDGYKQGRAEALADVVELFGLHADRFRHALREAANAEVRLDGDEVVIGDVIGSDG